MKQLRLIFVLHSPLKWEGTGKLQTPQYHDMKTKRNIRYGVAPVMSQAGAAPGPLPRMGPPSATSGHRYRSRYVKVKQRSRNKERKTRKLPDYSNKQQQQNCLNILQINISGISNKKIELAHLLSKENIHVALIQESQHQNTDPHISNYTHTACTHGRGDCQ